MQSFIHKICLVHSDYIIYYAIMYPDLQTRSTATHTLSLNHQKFHHRSSNRDYEHSIISRDRREF